MSHHLPPRVLHEVVLKRHGCRRVLRGFEQVVHVPGTSAGAGARPLKQRPDGTTRTNKNKREQTRTNGNKQEQTGTNKNKQEQTRTSAAANKNNSNNNM